MIVSDNANLYGSLFEKANAALNFTTDQDKITNIDEYFTCIKRLAEYEKQNKTDPIFTILPINEETFDIDANTRKINIPTSFMTAGIGVKGDEVAEVLYFTVDRYFDIADLYYKDILIQWRNADGDEGLSLTINKSLSFRPGKVTFGWPISSEITKSAGNIQFAVRFYDRFEDNEDSYLTYSFSTLTAAVKVNPSLDFEISDKDAISAIIIDRTQRIYDNLKDSSPTEIVNPAAVPIFEIELEDEKNLDELTNEIIINGETKKVFMVKAAIPDNAFGSVGNIKYSWTHEGKDGILLETPEFGDYYIFTEDESRQPNDTYYELKDGQYQLYIGSPGETFPANTYYEKYSYCVPKTAGIYKVVATNVAGRVSTANVTDKCLVPYAKEVIFSEIDNSVILEKEEIDGIKQNTYVAQEIGYEIKSQDKGILSYQWKYYPGYGKEDNKIELATNIANATNEKYEAKELGHYWLIVTNVYNNDTIICNPINPIRVTEFPTPPTITNFEINGQISALEHTKMINLNSEISYIKGQTVNTDGIYEYQWLKQNAQGWEEVVGQTAEKFKPTTSGAYACRITNVYNGERSSIETTNYVFFVN